VADEPDGIARACARLLEDEALRKTMVDRAHGLFMDRYQSTQVQDQLGALARRLATP
jgi:hypothetical protein